MDDKIKNYLLILTICSTIIENMGGFPLYVTATYFLVSLIDRRSFKAIINYKMGIQLCILWLVLFVYISITTLLYAVYRDPSLALMKWFKAILLFSRVLKDIPFCFFPRCPFKAQGCFCCSMMLSAERKMMNPLLFFWGGHILHYWPL